MTDPLDPPSGAVQKLDRHLSSLTLLIGFALFLALPFVLSAGAAFFLPLVSACVITVILAPLADRMVRLGLSNGIASALSIVFFAAVSVVVIVAIMQPAIALLAKLPELSVRATEILRDLKHWLGALGPAVDLERVFRDTSVLTAGSDLLTTMALSTPGALLEYFLTLLLVYFFVRSRVGIKRALLLERDTVSASLTAARTVRDVQDKVSHYVGTVALINLGVGAVVAGGTWLLGLENPIMWGGLAAILNFIPYAGPIVTTLLLGITGIVEFGSVWFGMVPALCYLGLHAVEANLITPAIVGRRLLMHPASLLIGLSYFTWIWGAPGAVLAIPLTIIIGVVLDRIGRPNLLGYLFGEPLFLPPDAGAEADQAG
jgi:predicted PurR-regulated permease PerM